MLSSQNANRPKGDIADDTTTSDLATNDQLLKADGYRPLIVSYQNGAAVKLADVANVQDSVEDLRTAGMTNGKPSVLLVIFREPGANIIATVDRVREALPQLKAAIPAAIDLTVVLDQTTTIRASVRDVEQTLLISIALVILIVFIFLRNVRATFIPSVAVPVSLIGTFGVMYLCRYSLDNLSLMALTISTGFVVDDAIVVIENVTRHLEQGMRPMEAALKGAQEIGFTVLSISYLTDCRIHPDPADGRDRRALVPGVCRYAVGRYSRFAHRFIDDHSHDVRQASQAPARGRSRQTLSGERGSVRLDTAHDTSTAWRGCCGTRRSRSVFFCSQSVSTSTSSSLCLKDFFRSRIPGASGGGIQGVQDTSFQAMRHRIARFVDIIKADPAVANVMAFTGGGAGTTTNTGRVFMALKPLDERNVSADQLINRLRPKLATVPGAALYLQASQDLRVGGRLGNAEYQYTIQSDNLED